MGNGKEGEWEGVLVVRERRRGEAGRREGEEVEQREGGREREMAKQRTEICAEWLELVSVHSL